MQSKTSVNIARIFSGVFNPFLIPFLGFLSLFLFTYLHIVSIQYKIIVLCMVYCFTVLMPLLSIHIYKRVVKSKNEEQQLSAKENRIMPHLLIAISYFFCYMLMRRLNLPPYMSNIIMGGLIAVMVSMAVELKWNLSEHTMGIGFLIGGLVAFSIIMAYNAVWWLCLFILVAGILGTSRILLGRHSLGEVLCGFFLGFCSSFFSILYL